MFLPPTHNNIPLAFPIQVPLMDHIPNLCECWLRVFLLFFRLCDSYIVGHFVGSGSLYEMLVSMLRIRVQSLQLQNSNFILWNGRFYVDFAPQNTPGDSFFCQYCSVICREHQEKLCQNCTE